MRTLKTSLALFLFVGLLMGALGQAPAAEAAAAKTKTVNLNSLLDMIKLNKGKVVIVNFFATWCPPCKEELPGLVNLGKAYPANKVAVIGVSVDQDPALVAPFVKQLGVNFPVFHASQDVTDAFNVRTIPHNVIYDASGQMAANVTGFVSEEDLKEFINGLLENNKK